MEVEPFVVPSLRAAANVAAVYEGHAGRSMRLRKQRVGGVDFRRAGQAAVLPDCESLT